MLIISGKTSGLVFVRPSHEY